MTSMAIIVTTSTTERRISEPSSRSNDSPTGRSYDGERLARRRPTGVSGRPAIDVLARRAIRSRSSVMAEVLAAYSDTIVGPDGSAYRAQACGAPSQGLWE